MPSLSDAVLEDLRFRVVQGFENRELTFDWLLMNYPADLGITADPYDASDLDAETTALLRNAIEQAFREKEKEAESWRRPNDYDRLLTAFAALDQQGIVALECPGLMQGDSVTCAVELAAVRDELGGVEAHGYCFFAWNDMARAIDGDGLSLAYGTFESEPEAPPIASPPPTLCPLCKGRGWIAPVDATQFPRGEPVILVDADSVRRCPEIWVRGARVSRDRLVDLRSNVQQRRLALEIELRGVPGHSDELAIVHYDKVIHVSGSVEDDVVNGPDGCVALNQDLGPKDLLGPVGRDRSDFRLRLNANGWLCREHTGCHQEGGCRGGANHIAQHN